MIRQILSWWRSLGGMGGIVRRGYSMAVGGRLTSGWRAVQSSADSELAWSLTKMRGRARELVRNAGYAKRAKVIVVNNVIGAGVGMQAQVRNQRDRLLTAVNKDIERAWGMWSRAQSCHTGGKLHFSDLERLAMGQVFETGEIFIRKHYSTFGDSKVPFALEVIEPERIADELAGPAHVDPGHDVRMGVEVDAFHRPIAYWIRDKHPGDIRTTSYGIGKIERVPADQIFHLYIVDRWPQVRGEPWLHTAARRLNDMEGYSEAEIVAARSAASYMGFIRTPDEQPLQPDAQEGSQRQIAFEPGMIEQLPPGYDFVGYSPNRPNPAMDPFMRLMLREVAAGVGVSYESLSRDYSQSNYSSSRLALLDDRDLWRQLQMWWLRAFRLPLHEEWLRQAVLARAVSKITLDAWVSDQEKWSSVSFKPRGWQWVDPTKEVTALKEAVRAGFTTVSDVIASTGGGRDFEDVMRERQSELAAMREMGIATDTEVVAPHDAPTVVETPPAEDVDDSNPAGGRLGVPPSVLPMRAKS